MLGQALNLCARVCTLKLQGHSSARHGTGLFSGTKLIAVGVSLQVSTMKRGLYLCWHLRHFCGRVGQESGICFYSKGINLPHSSQWGAPSPRTISQLSNSAPFMQAVPEC